MAGLQSVVSALPMIQQGVGIINEVKSSSSSRAGQAQAMAELQRKQNEQMQQAQDDAAIQRAKIEVDASDTERARRDALKRAVARQRASFAGSGVDARGGSSEAVLLGLFEESDAQRAERERLDALRLGALDSELAQRQSLNALQRTELSERQRLERAYDDSPSTLDLGLNFATKLF